MISQKKFLRESESLNFQPGVLAEFYQKLVEFIAEYHKPTTNWKKMMDIEKKYLWPVLCRLGNPFLPIYENAQENLRDEFVASIQEEIQIRMSIGASSDREILLEKLRSLSLRRIDFLEEILEITPEDRAEFRKESSWTKWLIAGGAIVAIGVIGKNIVYKSKDGKEKPIRSEK